jgi:hypothetical protein
MRETGFGSDVGAEETKDALFKLSFSEDTILSL